MKSRISFVGQLLFWALFLGPAAYAYFVWHWPILRVSLVTLFAYGVFLGGLVTVGALVSEITRRRRSKSMIEAANQLNLRCYPGQFRRELLADDVWNSDLFRSTDNDVRNLLHGVTPDADIKIFDAYLNVAVNEPRPWSADTRPHVVIRRFNQTVACVTSPNLKMPRFSLLRAANSEDDRGLSAKVSYRALGELFRGEKSESLVELPPSSALHGRYELRSTDPQAAGLLFHASVESLFEGKSDLLMCGEGPVFLLFREDRLADLDGVKELLETALLLARQFSSAGS